MKHETQLTRERITDPLRKKFCPALCVEKIPGTQFNRGLPDLVMCYKGVSVWVEVKKEGKQPTPQQLSKLRAHANAEGLSMVAYLEEKAVSLTIVEGAGFASRKFEDLAVLAGELAAGMKNARVVGAFVEGR